MVVLNVRKGRCQLLMWREYQISRPLQLISAALPLLILVGVYACGDLDNYRLFVYPNRSDLTVHREFGPYDSVEQARDKASAQMDKYSDGDYEIGKNCERRSDTTLWVCEETFR